MSELPPPDPTPTDLVPVDPISARAGIESARAAAQDARAKLSRTLSEIQQRLTPGNLVEDAIDNVRDKASNAVAAVKARPVLAIAAIGAISLFFSRKALARAVTKRFSKATETEDTAKGSSPSKPRTTRRPRRQRPSEETIK